MKQPDFESLGVPPCREMGMEKANKLYYAEDNDPDYRALTEQAKAACNSGCPYVTECLVFALRRKEPYVWGGTTESERKSMKRKAARAHGKNQAKVSA